MKLPDKVWAVVLDTLERFDGIRCDSPDLRDYVENHCDITLFDGGAFIADGNEFDLFVVPEKRGKWRIRKEISAFLAKLAETHSKAVIKIYPENKPSVRLAKWFGFKPVGRDGRQIVLERPLWVV